MLKRSGRVFQVEHTVQRPRRKSVVRVEGAVRSAAVLHSGEPGGEWRTLRAWRRAAPVQPALFAVVRASAVTG